MEAKSEAVKTTDSPNYWRESFFVNVWIYFSNLGSSNSSAQDTKQLNIEVFQTHMHSSANDPNTVQLKQKLKLAAGWKIQSLHYTFTVIHTKYYMCSQVLHEIVVQLKWYRIERLRQSVDTLNKFISISCRAILQVCSDTLLPRTSVYRGMWLLLWNHYLINKKYKFFKASQRPNLTGAYGEKITAKWPTEQGREYNKLDGEIQYGQIQYGLMQLPLV